MLNKGGASIVYVEMSERGKNKECIRRSAVCEIGTIRVLLSRALGRRRKDWLMNSLGKRRSERQTGVRYSACGFGKKGGAFP